jgi:hypothetical protein
MDRQRRSPNLGVTHGYQRLWTKALGYHERALEVAQKLGNVELISQYVRVIQYVKQMREEGG